MNRLLIAGWICCFVAVTETATAASATSEDTFRVEAPYQDVVAWLDANRPQAYRAANAEIVEDRGDGNYVVRSDSPLGSSRYLVHETRTVKQGVKTYRIKLTQRMSGRVADNLSIITVREIGSATEVTMSVAIDFEHRLAKPRHVRRVTDKSVSQTKTLLVRRSW